MKSTFTELRQGATIIRQQINERQEAAILAQEKRDQEVKVLLKSIEERAEQEKLERMSKIKAQKELMSVVGYSFLFVNVLPQRDRSISNNTI